MTTPKAASSTLYSPTLSTLGIGVLALSLWGCDWVGALKSKSARAEETFTFKGQLPAEFGIDAIAFYGPDKPVQANCQYQTLEAKTANRWYGKRYSAAIQAQPQEFNFEIPLSYHKDSCGMKLGRVKLEINGRYGHKDWQQAYGKGNFYVEPETTPDSAVFDTEGALHITANCTWLFQQSKARSILGEIEKLMSCKGAGAILSHDNLTSKTINLAVYIHHNEKPTMRNRWIETNTGWMPCKATEKSNRCQTPPIFRTF